MRIRVLHTGDYEKGIGYSEYDVDAVEIHEPVLAHPVYFGTLMLLDAALPEERREALKDGLPK